MAHWTPAGIQEEEGRRVGWEQGGECPEEEAQGALWVGRREGTARPVGYSLPAQTEVATSVLFSSSRSFQMLSGLGQDSQRRRRTMSLSLSPDLQPPTQPAAQPQSSRPLCPPLSNRSHRTRLPTCGLSQLLSALPFLTGILSALLCFTSLCPLGSSFTLL